MSYQRHENFLIGTKLKYNENEIFPLGLFYCTFYSTRQIETYIGLVEFQ